MIIPLKIYSTDKYFFITKEKVASRFLESLFGDDLDSGIVFDYMFDINNKKIKPFIDTNSDIQKQTINDFEDALNKKLKKDIIILYRNPNNRFLSGIIQDFNSNIDDKGGEFTLSLLYKLFNINSDIEEFMENNKGALQLSELETQSGEVIEFLKKSLTSYMEYSAELNFDGIHTKNYLHEFYILIKENYFDSNKIILCDIDINLDSLIKTLSLNPDYTRKNSNNNFKKLLHEILDDKNNKKLSEKIEFKLETEFIFYDMLKRHPNNYKK